MVLEEAWKSGGRGVGLSWNDLIWMVLSLLELSVMSDE